MTLRALTLGYHVDAEELLLAVDELLDLADTALRLGRLTNDREVKLQELRRGLEALQRELRSQR